MAAASPYSEHQGDGWAHRFWKKARKFAAGKSSRALRDGAANADVTDETADGAKSPQRRDRMRLSDYQKQMHEERRQKTSSQSRPPSEEK
jgi:hypothetical protein